MKLNLTGTTLITTALAGLIFLGLNTNSLKAENLVDTPNQSQTERQQQQWTAQHGPMMGPYWRGSGGWGCCGQYGRIYDPSNLETVSGEVVSIDTFTPISGMSQGMHLLLRTDDGTTIPVHLGPYWYLENQDIAIEPNDKIEVRGSRVNFAGEPAIIAAEVQKGDTTLRLRDESGFPMWSGWRNDNWRNGNYRQNYPR